MVECDSFRVGNSSFMSNISICVSATATPGTIEITYTIENRVMSGGGFFFDPEIEVTLDGEVIHTQSHSLSTGGSLENTVTADNVPTGSHNVCVNITNRP